MKAVHSWMEYQYRFANANDNCKMWIRDEHRIYELSNGSYVTADNAGWRDEMFKTFEEAEKAFANENRPPESSD
jgi:hypothetical protein